MSVSHLLFDDDIIILYKKELHWLMSFHFVLLCFEAISGLKVNMGKSSLIHVTKVQNVEDLPHILGSLYLLTWGFFCGLPLCGIRLLRDVKGD